jgi:hypothetical protein
MHRFAAYNICWNDSGLRNTEDILLKLTTSFSCNYNLNGTLMYIKLLEGPSWPWSYGIWNYNYLCNQYLSPLKLWDRIRVLDATLCDKPCQSLVLGRWFSPATPVSSTNKTDRHDIIEILLKVVLNTITLKLYEYNMKQNQEKHRTIVPNKGNNKITELRTILQRESQNS